MNEKINWESSNTTSEVIFQDNMTSKIEEKMNTVDGYNRA